MSERFYSASLSRTQGRNTWAIIFRHPKRTDPSTSKEGLRVRQSLKTENEQEAKQLCDQMNVLLASPELWSLDALDQARKTFDPRIVDIFFYKLEGGEIDSLKIREDEIELPSSQTSNYRRALFLGATGAGKTTLLRQIIGTDPTLERFPATSRAKTTVHETEVILRQGAFHAVVTFFPMEDVREHLKECVSAAILGSYRKESDSNVMRRLLNHVNQRFRFSYMLGNGPIKEASDFDDDVEPAAEIETSELLTHTNEVLIVALSSVKKIAVRHGESLRIELNASDEKDQRVIDELFEEELDNRTREDETFQQVVDALMDEIEERFALLTNGRLQKSKIGWPLAWTWESEDRGQFIKSLSRFSSNYAPLFGTLLTPLVNGVRVAGPFFPTWNVGQPKLVLLDGEGLLHDARSSAMSTSLTRRIEMSDAVVVVDKPDQGLHPASIGAMKELVASGNVAKLIFAFTHFDRIGGDNLPTPADRVQHILASAENVLAAIGEELGPFAERALRARLASSRVFLAGLEQKLDDASPDGKRTAKQLTKLLEMIDDIVERPKPADSRPVYGMMHMGYAIKSAVTLFHDEWHAKLGQPSDANIEKAPWQKVKALSSRFATQRADEYDYLKPVKDLQQKLQQKIYIHLQNPLSWTGPEPSDDDKQIIFDQMANDLSSRLLDITSRRLRVERLQEWRGAFGVFGSGSTFQRAKLIAEQVYDRAAPIPDEKPSPDRNAFLDDVANALRASIENAGAQLR